MSSEEMAEIGTTSAGFHYHSRTVFCHAAFPQRFITSGLESCTMKYFGLLAIVLSLAAAEIYFQEKFDEGAVFVAYIRI